MSDSKHMSSLPLLLRRFPPRGSRYASLTMDHYCVNRNGKDHEVHNLNRCRYLPDVANQLLLGPCVSGARALERAREHFPQADGCRCCMREFHRK